MKKIKEPNPQVIKFESMDVIATSSAQEAKGAVGLRSVNYSNNVYGLSLSKDSEW